MSGNAGVVTTHIFASHSATGHLEVVFPVILWVKGVLRAGTKQSPHRLLIRKHQVNITYRKGHEMQQNEICGCASS